MRLRATLLLALASCVVQPVQRCKTATRVQEICARATSVSGRWNAASAGWRWPQMRSKRVVQPADNSPSSSKTLGIDAQANKRAKLARDHHLCVTIYDPGPEANADHDGRRKRSIYIIYFEQSQTLPARADDTRWRTAPSFRKESLMRRAAAEWPKWKSG